MRNRSAWKKLGIALALTAVLTMGGCGAVGSTAAETGTSQTTENTAEESGTVKAAVEKTSTSKASTSDESGSDTSVSATEKSADGDLSVQEVAANAMPAMVAITNTSVQQIQNYFGGYGFGGSNGQGQTAESVSKGTGVIIKEADDAIYIATNAHVISDASQLSVAFTDDSAASAEVVGSDTANDLAVIKVNKADLSSDTLSAIKVMTLGSSDDLQVGESVVAIGNALGYGQSVSSGIVSALNRSIATEDETTGAVSETEGLIQTDAAINPGNSGGALLNLKGELVGINSAKYADTSVEGMGYAIPIDYAGPILEKLISGEGTSSDASAVKTSSSGVALGITCTTLSEDMASYYNLPTGVYVTGVETGSVAEAAGIQEGDIITAVDGTQISSTEELKTALSSYKTGDEASLSVTRSSGMRTQTGTLTVTFGNKSASGDAGSGTQAPDSTRETAARYSA